MQNTHRRNLIAAVLLMAAAVTAMTLATVMSSPYAAHAGTFENSHRLDHQWHIYQANTVFDCLQSRSELRHSVRTLMVHRYQVRNEYSADFAEIRADYMLSHRYFFLELNTMFDWRDLGDPLMDTIYVICSQPPTPTAHYAPY